MLDSANLEEIRLVKELGVLGGVTTNPLIIKRGIKESKYRGKFLDLAKRILELAQDKPVFFQVVGHTVEELEEAGLQPEERKRRENWKTKVTEVLDTLTLRERDVIKMRYGIDNGYTSTLEEVARAHGITRERARQIEAKAIGRLRHPPRARELAVYAGLEHRFEAPRPSPDSDPRNIPLSDLELGIRTRHCLRKLDALVLGDITQYREQDLLAMRYFGESSLEEIRTHLQQHGLKLKE